MDRRIEVLNPHTHTNLAKVEGGRGGKKLTTNFFLNFSV